MRGLARHLGHPDPVELRVEALEHRGVGVQLVSQHHDEASALGFWVAQSRWHHPPVWKSVAMATASCSSATLLSSVARSRSFFTT